MVPATNGAMLGGSGTSVKEEKDVKEEVGQSQGNNNSSAIFSSTYANSMKPPLTKKRKVMK